MKAKAGRLEPQNRFPFRPKAWLLGPEKQESGDAPSSLEQDSPAILLPPHLPQDPHLPGKSTHAETLPEPSARSCLLEAGRGMLTVHTLQPSYSSATLPNAALSPGPQRRPAAAAGTRWPPQSERRAPGLGLGG